MNKPVKYSLSKPPVQDFINMRAGCGWGRLEEAAVKNSLEAGLVNICAYDEDGLIGFGRVIGDGAIYFYIQDLIVKEQYQGQGIGREILKQLILETRKISSSGAVIGLMSARGKEAFYQKEGFILRPNNQYGAGMILNL